jgi:hypothetical protein
MRVVCAGLLKEIVILPNMAFGALEFHLGNALVLLVEFEILRIGNRVVGGLKPRA